MAYSEGALAPRGDTFLESTASRMIDLLNTFDDQIAEIERFNVRAWGVSPVATSSQTYETGNAIPSPPSATEAIRELLSRFECRLETLRQEVSRLRDLG